MSVSREEWALLASCLEDEAACATVLNLIGQDEWGDAGAAKMARWLGAYLGSGRGSFGRGEQALTAQSEAVKAAGVDALWRHAMGFDPIDRHAVGWYIERVRFAAAQSRIGKASVALAALATRPADGCTRAELAALAVSALESADVVRGAGEEQSLERVGDAWAAERKRRAEGCVDAVPIPTGIPELDEVFGGGMRAGQLVVVGARPGMGKTAFAMQAAVATAATGARVGVISMEMSHKELDIRVLSHLSGVSGRLIRDDQLTTEEAEAVMVAEEGLRALDIRIVDRAGQTLPEVVARARGWALGGRLRLLVVDHLHLLRLAKADREDIALSDATKTLKAVAKSLGITVLLLVQASRDYEKRGASGVGHGWRGAMPRPRMSDLKGSGGIEADADIVLFPLRPSGEHLTAENRTEAQLELVKHRGGELAIVEVGWDGPCTSFRPPLALGPLRDDEML